MLKSLEIHIDRLILQEIQDFSQCTRVHGHFMERVVWIASTESCQSWHTILSSVVGVQMQHELSFGT